MTLHKLRQSLVASGCNLNDQAIVLIEACIESGIDRGPDIVREVSALGLHRGSVGAQLKHNTGRNPERYRWYKTESGRYRLHA
jgi:hypothetical protein